MVGASMRRLGLIAVACSTVLACMAVLAVPTGAASARTPDRSSTSPPVVLAARLRVGVGSQLIIGAFPVFPYDGRAGSSTGTITERGGGHWDIRFPAATTRVPPLAMVAALPDLPLRVHIEPRDLVGTLDVCTGQMTLQFDARFRPEVFGSYQTPLSVVTPLVSARPMDQSGHLRLEGTAQIPPTGDWFVDGLLGLPTGATAQLEADLDVGATGELPACPGIAKVPQLTLEIGARSRLSIGSVGPLAYDGGSVPLSTPLVPQGSGRYGVVFDPAVVRVPPLRIHPLLDVVRVEITPRSLRGTYDACTGALDVDLDARFRPVLFGVTYADLSVVTHLVLDRTGRLVGSARVSPTSDALVTWILGLPATAVADLEVHLDVVGANCTR